MTADFVILSPARQKASKFCQALKAPQGKTPQGKWQILLKALQDTTFARQRVVNVVKRKKPLQDKWQVFVKHKSSGNFC